MALFQKGHIPWHKGKGKMWGIPLYCKTCGVEYILDGEKGGHSGKVYCSKKCKDNNSAWKLKISKTKSGVPNLKMRGVTQPHMVGERNSNWRGGRSRGYKTGYWSTQYKNWRIAVFTRDNFTCQNCDRKGLYLEAHHIKSFTKYPKYRFDISNGVTLCRECHTLIDEHLRPLELRGAF